MGRARLALVIPAYCEEETIGGVVRGASPFGDVIVVDDGSEDATAQEAEEAGAIVVSHPVNRGYDAALDTGMARVARDDYEAVVVIDADGEHDPEFISTFAEKLLDEHVAMVVGRRPRKQRWAENVYCRYIEQRYGVDDILCGMKGFRPERFEDFGMPAEKDMVGTGRAVNGLRLGLECAVVPVRGTPREGVPRFGGGWKPNLRILRAMKNAIIGDLKQKAACQ